MLQSIAWDAKRLAAEIDCEVRALPVKNTPSVRAIRRRYSRQLKKAAPAFILDVARELRKLGYRGLAFELIQFHKPALASLGEAQLEELGQGINSWWSVDSFALSLAGLAWRAGQVPDSLIQRWAGSPDRWWRRAALVSTVPLNVRSQGGSGDVSRTMRICRLLVSDRDDMVVKALSWALRELVAHDRQAVRQFLEEHNHLLASRVKREVVNKLTTGLKSPKRRSG